MVIGHRLRVHLCGVHQRLVGNEFFRAALQAYLIGQTDDLLAVFQIGVQVRQISAGILRRFLAGADRHRERLLISRPSVRGGQNRFSAGFRFQNPRIVLIADRHHAFIAGRDRVIAVAVALAHHQGVGGVFFQLPGVDVPERVRRDNSEVESARTVRVSGAACASGVSRSVSEEAVITGQHSGDMRTGQLSVGIHRRFRSAPQNAVGIRPAENGVAYLRAGFVHVREAGFQRFARREAAVAHGVKVAQHNREFAPCNRLVRRQRIRRLLFRRENTFLPCPADRVVVVRRVSYVCVTHGRFRGGLSGQTVQHHGHLPPRHSA